MQDFLKRLNRSLEVRDGTAVSAKCCDMCDDDAVCPFLKKVILHSPYLLQKMEIILNQCFGRKK